MKRSSVPIYESTDYDELNPHTLNRPITDKPELEKDMIENGFNPAYPIVVTKHPDTGLMTVLQGHHRLHYAKALGIKFYVIFDWTGRNIHEAEAVKRQNWSTRDWISSQVKAGNPDYEMVMEVVETHHLPLGMAATLVMGKPGSAGHVTEAIRSGQFKVGNQKLRFDTCVVTDECRRLGVEFATHTAFVAAVSRTMAIPEVDLDRMLQKLGNFSGLLKHHAGAKEYLGDIEMVYNYRVINPANRVPIVFTAAAAQQLEEAKARKAGRKK